MTKIQERAKNLHPEPQIRRMRGTHWAQATPSAVREQQSLAGEEVRHHLSLSPEGLLRDVDLNVTSDDSCTMAIPSAASDSEERLETPIILLNGYGHEHGGLSLVHRHLVRAGCRHVVSATYNPRATNVSQLAEHLSHLVEKVLQSSTASHVHLVGHNLGGIVARCYIQLLGGHERVGTVITVGTPHEGSQVGGLDLGPAALQLQPNSSLLRHLHDASVPGEVRWIAYYGERDQLVRPSDAAALKHPALAATNVLVQKEWHLSVLVAPHVARSIAHQLLRP